MVIDVLNMPVNVDYQVEVWGDYSIQIQDYVRLGIAQELHTESGKDLTTMIDPYSYRDKLSMPKMIFIGTNDEYWPVDAIKHYIGEIPGENYIHYIANAGHDLGGGQQALVALSAFFGNTLLQEGYPVCDWSIAGNGSEVTLTVETSVDRLRWARFWSADSEDRDFRNESWSNSDVETGGQKEFSTQVSLPESGFRAFYLDLVYASPVVGAYTKSTRMFVADGTGVLEN
jgi:PhoPQ-activated pathogenicity-related protein